MQKIPTLFLRDQIDRSRVTAQLNPDCAWVAAGQGTAHIKLDGTCCMARNGQLFRRREVREGDPIPPGFEKVDEDPVTQKLVGWVPVGAGPEDRWHREAIFEDMPDGTYELIGPKIQGNPEGVSVHALVKHDEIEDVPGAPRTYEGLRDWLDGRDIEGLVFHHPDGRMAKIKGRDFGLRRPSPPFS